MSDKPFDPAEFTASQPVVDGGPEPEKGVSKGLALESIRAPSNVGGKQSSVVEKLLKRPAVVERLLADHARMERLTSIYPKSLASTLEQLNRMGELHRAHIPTAASLNPFDRYRSVASVYPELGRSVDAATQIARAIERFTHGLAGQHLARFAESGVMDSIRNLAIHDMRMPSIPNSLLTVSSGFSGFSHIDGITKAGAIQSLYTKIASFDHIAESRLLYAAEAMRSPWAVDHLGRSLGVLHSYLEIGRYAGSSSPFGFESSAYLRSRLGDWRDEGDIPALDNAQVRSDFYIERGFDDELTDAPDEVVEAQLEVSELTTNWPALFEIEVFVGQEPAEIVRRRRERAAAHILTFELYVREFIGRVMSKAFGPTWWRSRLPNGLLEEWIEKRDKAVASGQPEEPLLSYADFSDYTRIVCRMDNFREVFAAFFHQVEDVRETFRRLGPIRNAAFHTRLILPIDEITLFAETKRVFYATYSAVKED